MKRFVLTLLILFLATVVWAGEGQYPVIHNIAMPVPDTEYSLTFDAGVRKLTMQCDTAYDFRMAYTTGAVATPTPPYVTIKSGSVYKEDDISTKMEGQTVYFATDQTDAVVEILLWY